MFRLLQSFRKNRHLIQDFVVRDLRSRYVGSSMGFFWSVIFPVINLFVYMFVFRLVLNTRWGDQQGALEVSFVMLAGIIVWTSFGETLSRSTNCLIENSNLIQKIVFPSEALPVYLTISSLINMCVGLPVVLIGVLLFGYLLPPDAQLVRSRPDLEVIYEAHDAKADPPEFAVALDRGWRARAVLPIEFGGTATRGEDYLCDVDEVVLPAGQTRIFVRIVPVQDTALEGEESIVVRLGEADRHGAGEVAEMAFTLRDNTLPADASPEPPAVVEPLRVDAPAMAYSPLALGAPLLALPLLLVLQALFTVGIGLFLSAINVYLRDVYHLVGVAVTVWMFATPIFYPAFMVENAGFGWMLELNPMHWLIDCYRNVLLYAHWPALLSIVKFSVVAVAAFWVGGRVFLRNKPRFPDLL